jgi:hypothetical protein
VLETPLFRTAGSQDRVRVEPVAPDGGGAVVWRGVAGDYVGDTQRWDFAGDPRGGAVVVFTGGPDANRAGFLARRVLDTDPWMLPGYSAAWKMAFLRPLLRGL